MKTNKPHSTMKKTSLCVLGLCAAVLFPGCDHQAGGTANAPAQQKIRLAFVGNTPDDYWAVVRLGCDFATRQLGDVDLDFRYPATGTVAGQQELLRDLNAGGVDGVAISPLDADNQTDFLNHIATNTLLVCADSDAEKCQRACYIGTDNVAAGKQAAELIKAALPHGGKIVLFVGFANAQNTRNRIHGLQEALAGSNLQILDTLVDGAKSASAQQNAEVALKQNPDLAGMVALNGYQGPAILTAVRGAGKAGQVKIVCFDDASDTLAGIGAGEIYGTVVQRPLDIGFQAITRMDKYLHGDKTQLAGGKVFIPSEAITQDNVHLYQQTRENLARPLDETK